MPSIRRAAVVAILAALTTQGALSHSAGTVGADNSTNTIGGARSGKVHSVATIGGARSGVVVRTVATIGGARSGDPIVVVG